MYYWLDVAAEGRPEEQLENWINRIHQFFTHTFFPAYEHNLLWTKEMQEERQRQTTENRITVEKAKANAKYFTFLLNNYISFKFHLHYYANYFSNSCSRDSGSRSRTLIIRHVCFRLNEQQRAEEEVRAKEKLEEDEERCHVLDDLNNSTATLTIPVTSSNSVDLKQSPTNKKKKKRK